MPRLFLGRLAYPECAEGMDTRDNTGSSECVDIENNENGDNAGSSAGTASLGAGATIGMSFGALVVVLMLAFVGYRIYLSKKTPPLAAAEGAPGAGAGTDTAQLEEGATITTENPMQQQQMMMKKKPALHRPTATVDTIDVYVEKPFPLNPVSSITEEEL